MASVTTTLSSTARVTRVGKRRFDPYRAAVYAFLTFMAFIYVAPLVYMLLKSLMDVFEANGSALIPSTLHFENYNTVLFDRNINLARYFLNTIVLEVLTITGQTVICLLAAYGFSRLHFPGRDVLFGIFLMTIFIPVTVILVPRLVLVTYISRFFESISPSLAWLNNWPSLVVPFLASTFSIFLLRQFFLQVPEDLWDAARMDGSSHLRYLFSVLVPVSRAAVVTTILFSFIATWSSFEWPLLVTSDESWKPIGAALFSLRTNDYAQTQFLMAGAVVALLPILLLYLVAQKQFTQGITTTGLKG